MQSREPNNSGRNTRSKRNVDDLKVGRKPPTLTGQVGTILRRSRRARDCDNFLTIQYFEHYFGAKFSAKAEKTLMQVPFKSIIGTRQVIQNKKHKYPPSRKALIERGWKEKRIRDYMSKFS